MFWLFFSLFALAALGASLWGYRAYTTGDTSLPLGGWFAPRPPPRLGVVEQATVDNRRRLVLIRRDDVEHLIMTGGPVDVVIETGISTPFAAEAAAPALEEAPSPPVFTRQPRNFGQQAVNE
jgi:hypothetical protein